jgi:hypothetical protein
MQELPVRERSTETAAEHHYFCAYCGTIITSEHERVERDGAFSHTFTNPAGIVFGIGCFGQAPGCALAGEYTRDHTWFRGYGWCYALCAGCASHLGWHYEGTGRDPFFGLILDKLIAP